MQTCTRDASLAVASDEFELVRGGQTSNQSAAVQCESAGLLGLLLGKTDNKSQATVHRKGVASVKPGSMT